MTLSLRSAVGSFAAALLLASPLFADDPAAAPKPLAETMVEAASQPCTACDPCNDASDGPKTYLNDFLFGDCFTERTGIKTYGWISQGYTANPDGPTNRTNGPVTFNYRSNDYQLNQIYWVMERPVDLEKFDVGGRVDLLYGTDYFFTTALGLETNSNDFTPKWNEENAQAFRTAPLGPNYGLAMPQAYAEFSAPVAKGLSVKVGHMYTMIAYEVVQATGNFFYSHAYTHQYGEPFTHTGAYATLKLTDKLSVHNCIIRGWDNWADNNNAWSYMGGFAYSLGDSTTLNFSLITGPEHNEPATGVENASRNRFMYSVFLVHKMFCDKLTYVIQHDYGIEEDAAFVPAAGAPGTFKDGQWYGLNQYFLYSLTDKLAAGIRAEWFRDDDNIRVFPNAAFANNVGPGTNYYALTAGLNIKPSTNLMLRPELRWDWSTQNNAFDDFTSQHQMTAAVDVIFQF